MLKVGSKSVVATLSLVCLSLTLLSGVLLSAPSSSADNDSHIDDVSIIVPISCNLIGTNTTHSKTINPGTTEEDIGKTTLKAFCNDNNGFAIYAIGYTNDTDGTTTLIGGTTNLTIATNTSTSGSSSWSMKLTKETNASNAYNPSNMTINNGYDSYSVVPTNWTKVATFSSATDSTLGAVLYTTYKVHIAPGQAADTYSGKVKYTLFHPNNSCLYYTIHFDPGTGSGAMEDQPICRNTSTALSTNTLSPPSGGYEFKEWNTEPDGTGTSYSNEQIINTNLADVGGSVTLYAIWWIPPRTIATMEYMQDVTSCPSTLTTGQVYTIKDSRDEEQYSVAKLADENCWMLDNLMLDPTDSVTAAKINPTTTNADSTSLNCLLGHTTGCTSPYTTVPITTGSASYTTAKILTSYKNNIVDKYGSNNGKIGILYDYCAASAGTYCYDYNESGDKPNTFYDLGGDLCPIGWHIPTGGNSGQYQGLYSAYSENLTDTMNAFSVSLSGYYNSDVMPSFNGQNLGGYCWSSTDALYLVGNSLRFGTSSSESRDDISIPIRCVFGSTTGL